VASRPSEYPLPESKPNPALAQMAASFASPSSGSSNGDGASGLKLRVPMERRCAAISSTTTHSIHPSNRYFAETCVIDWPPEVQEYNRRFTKTLEAIKKRHDPTVTTVAQGVLEWKRTHNARNIGVDMQAWLDRFYMSRIGIRFLIGQRAFYAQFCGLTVSSLIL
jgi:pyruvate dehydrogenase kinase 2/3/4